MKKLKISLLATFLLFGLSCKNFLSDKTESHFAACVTENGEKIGVADKEKVFVLNAENGEIIKTSETSKKYGATVCSAGNEVFAVYSDEIKNIETEENYPRRIAGSTVFGINSESNLVSYDGRKISGSMKEKGKSVEIKVENPLDQSDDLKLLEVSPEKLDANERNKRYFTIIPVKLLENNALLVFGGGSAREAAPDEFTETDPDIWGFYRLNLQNGEIQSTKAIDKADRKADLFTLPVFSATLDGNFAAAAFSDKDWQIILVYDLNSSEEIFRKIFDEEIKTENNEFTVNKIYSVAFSKNADKLAIAAELFDEGRGKWKREYRIFVYDLQGKNEINNFSVIEEPEIINFSENEIILSAKNQTIAKINVQNGEELWKTELAKR